MTDTDRLVVWLREAMDAAQRGAEAAAADTGGVDWEYDPEIGTLRVVDLVGGSVATGSQDFLDPAPGAFMARNDPAAVLRRIAADRKTLDRYEDTKRVLRTYADPDDAIFAGAELVALGSVVLLLAEGYGWSGGE
ncbi:DUF6221 family protein [Streptomyces sp. NPDC056309]|uniref:DUF6221 family protein n=1 Tax=Streptomyces sp. NPDC056309 TaxID=3345781 RepID=UPI0035E00959